MAQAIADDVDAPFDATQGDRARHPVRRQGGPQHQANDFELFTLEQRGGLFARQLAVKRSDLDRVTGSSVRKGHE